MHRQNHAARGTRVLSTEDGLNEFCMGFHYTAHPIVHFEKARLSAK